MKEEQRGNLYIIYFSARGFPAYSRRGCVCADCYSCPCISCTRYNDGEKRVKVTEEQAVFFKNQRSIKIERIIEVTRPWQ